MTIKQPLLIVMALLAYAGAAHAQDTARKFDGSEVARLGAVYEKTAREGRYETGQEFAESQYFRGFVIGVALTSARLGFLCPPESGVNFRELWASTATFLRENPEHWTHGPEEIVMAALSKTLPCERKAESEPKPEPESKSEPEK